MCQSMGGSLHKRGQISTYAANRFPHLSCHIAKHVKVWTGEQLSHMSLPIPAGFQAAGPSQECLTCMAAPARW